MVTPLRALIAALAALIRSPRYVLSVMLELIKGRRMGQPRVASAGHRRLKDSLKSINWHLLRQCNYNCAFCYHVTHERNTRLRLEEAKRGLRLLAKSGMEKINFSGGEPFLCPYLGVLCKFCKEELRPLGATKVYVSIITNGSLVTERWIKEFGRHVDMIGVSVDSCSDDKHRELGRWSETLAKKGEWPGHISKALQVSEWCHQYGIRFKVNTVVNIMNADDDMTDLIRKLRPMRWKVFELLVINGENTGKDAKGDAPLLKPSNGQFQSFVKRHEALLREGLMIVENNSVMRNSYIIIDEQMRFLDNASGGKVPSQSSILDRISWESLTEVQKADFAFLQDSPELLPVALGFEGVTFDSDSFRERRADFYEASSGVPDIEDLGAVM
eukprot:RCo045615